jgi:two-component system, cell cycle sensor histidine kinase and response regulator CckA
MGSSIHVLVVDDALDYAEMVVQFLRASGEWTGASIDIAATYDNAVTALTTGGYDVAIVDYWLGARDGVTLLADVRARGIDTPIVILTAYGAEDVAVKAMKAGAADYLPKTQVSVEALDRAIRYALALRDKERQRSQAEVALRASEERFRALVENSSDALLLIDAQGRIQYMAPSSARHFGWTPDEVIGRSLFDVIHPEDRDQIAGAMSGPLADAGESTTVEIRVQHADGAYRTLEAVAVNHVNDPSVGAIVVNARDVTERRRLEEQLRHSQKMEALGQLAGGVSHDFTNLLTAILGYCELALSDLRPDDPMRHDLEEIRSAGERASSLTRQLMAFARRQILQPQIVDVNALVRQLERLVRRLLSAQIELVTTLGPDVSRVKVDPVSIEQVIVNLAVHARDAMPGGGRVTIETANLSIDGGDGSDGSMQPGPYVLIAVRDTGEGMDPEARERVFEPFFVAGEQGKSSGLGLATVYATVRQNGGHIQVESQPGAGTCFNIFLPPAVSVFIPRSADRTDHIEDKGGWETVLVVEQDDAVRALAREVLRRHGYAVLEARHGVDALRLAERHRDPIHLLMTDVVTPHMSGRDVAERLTSARPTMKVLFVLGQAGDELAGDLARGSTFLRKPFTPDALARKVRVLLDR